MNKVFLALVVVVVIAQPQAPLWPNIFWQNFTERTTDPQYGVHEDTGTYFYNFNLPSYRIDRSNGQFNYFCGIGGPYANISTPCTHFVVNGNRFMFYPAKNTCYYCCNSTNGCGVLKPTWMSDATYVDTEVHDGVMTYKWLKIGNQRNYLYETVNSVPLNRVTVSIVEEPSDTFNFGPRSLTLPANALDLPSICTVSNVANWGACQELRG